VIGLERALWLPRVERDGNSLGNRHFNNQIDDLVIGDAVGVLSPNSLERSSCRDRRARDCAAVEMLQHCSTRRLSHIICAFGQHRIAPTSSTPRGRGRGLSINFDSTFFTKSPARGTLGSNPSFWSRERHPHPPSRSANSRPAFVVGLFFSQGSEWRSTTSIYTTTASRTLMVKVRNVRSRRGEARGCGDPSRDHQRQPSGWGSPRLTDQSER
jgi:hypothetical protein